MSKQQVSGGGGEESDETADQSFQHREQNSKQLSGTGGKRCEILKINEIESKKLKYVKARLGESTLT